MNSINKFFRNPDIRLFAGYMICAGGGVAVGFVFLYVLTEFFDMWYFYSALVFYFSGMITNYSLNKYLNFRNKSKQIIPQFGLFAMVALVGLVFNQLILYSLVEFAELWYISAEVIAMSIVMFWNFYGHRRFTFSVFI